MTARNVTLFAVGVTAGAALWVFLFGAPWKVDR